MWHSLVKAALHVAVHSTLRNRPRHAQGQPASSNTPAHAAPRLVAPPVARPRPALGVGVVLIGILGVCCLSTGVLSIGGNLSSLAQHHANAGGADPVTGILTGFVVCIFPSALMLAYAGWAYARSRLETRLVLLVEAEPNRTLEAMAETLGVTPAKVRATWLEAARKGYVTTRADVIGDVPSSMATPVVNAVTPDGARSWTGTCPFCRATVHVMLSPDARPKCPVCRAGLAI